MLILFIVIVAVLGAWLDDKTEKYTIHLILLVLSAVVLGMIIGEVPG